MVKIRRGSMTDRLDFSKLMLMSAPYFSALFGPRIEHVLQAMFCHPANLFSHIHTKFAELDGQNAGMVLSYSWKTKKKENLTTGYLLFKSLGWNLLKKLPVLLEFDKTVGQLGEFEYYLSNIAVYPQYRGMGIGKRLMLEAEADAKLSGARKIVLDVESDNTIALRLYRKLGYEIIDEFTVHLNESAPLRFYRCAKFLD